MEFKPLNVQFEIEDEQTVDDLLSFAAEVAKRRGDRRLRAANVAKEIFLRVWKEHPELLREFFAEEASSVAIASKSGNESEVRPKTARKR